MATAAETRAFCYVDDLVIGLVSMMATPEEETGPVNLANPHEIPVRELVERIIRLTGARSRIVHRTLPEDDPAQRCPDIGLARQRLGWEPVVDLDVGLARTINYFEHFIAQ